MKYILVLLFILPFASNSQTMKDSDSLNKLKVGTDFKPTNYSKGFEYLNNQGQKSTLLNYEKVTTMYGVDIYRWQIRIAFGVSAIGWTDDCWIDVALGKAYLDANINKIIYK